MQRECNGFFQRQRCFLLVLAGKRRQVSPVSLVPHIKWCGLLCANHMETLEAAIWEKYKQANPGKILL